MIVKGLQVDCKIEMGQKVDYMIEKELQVDCKIEMEQKVDYMIEKGLQVDCMIEMEQMILLDGNLHMIFLVGLVVLFVVECFHNLAVMVHCMIVMVQKVHCMIDLELKVDCKIVKVLMEHYMKVEKEHCRRV